MNTVSYSLGCLCDNCLDTLMADGDSRFTALKHSSPLYWPHCECGRYSTVVVSIEKEEQ